MNPIPSSVRTTPGSYLLITVHGAPDRYLVEVIQAKPLLVKATENGPLSQLDEGDINEVHILGTLRFQRSRAEADVLLRELAACEEWLDSGLASLGLLPGTLSCIGSIDDITYPETI